MTDTMLFGILKMPFEMAMKDEISRLQYYARVQELVGRFEAQQKAEPVAHVLFRQDDDGLEPIMFYPPKIAPDPRTLKDRFVLKDVWLSPPPQRQWVGLEIEEVQDSYNSDYQAQTRAVEKLLKERNA